MCTENSRVFCLGQSYERENGDWDTAICKRKRFMPIMDGQMQIQTKSQILRRVGPAKKSDECRVDEARLSSLDGRKDRARKRLLIKQTQQAKTQQHRVMNAGHMKHVLAA